MYGRMNYYITILIINLMFLSVLCTNCNYHWQCTKYEYCHDYMCKCQPEYVLVSGKCLGQLLTTRSLDFTTMRSTTSTTIIYDSVLGYRCDSNQNCNGLVTSAICVNRICVCKPGYEADGIMNCRPITGIRLLGDHCSTHSQCKSIATDRSKVCMSNRCSCTEGYLPIDSYRCIKDFEPLRTTHSPSTEAVGYGSYCQQDLDCQRSSLLMICRQSSCLCIEGYVPLGKYICYNMGSYFTDFQISLLGGSCVNTVNCQGVNAICENGECSCRKGYFPVDKWTCLMIDDNSDDEIIPQTVPSTTKISWWPWSPTTHRTQTTLDSTVKNLSWRTKCVINKTCVTVDKNSHCARRRCVCNIGYDLINGEKCVKRKQLQKPQSRTDCN
ncbi:unnamed protein product [Didymodactylos carnosus]|uniref:EGF-like domain-containing protein n=1 Tax=Didymodactylos carnosus TaxID=1234261 RepID=A0A813QG40_9BILA|nr:unnamed protein product [Didymodactylos carnosus]CAF3548946.1 unnamed protein product [Didymodactylos carnosus]